MAKSSNKPASNVTPLPGRKVADTTATMGSNARTERATTSWRARAAYEKTGGNDVWIVDGQKAEDSRTLGEDGRVYDLDKKTVTINYTVTCQKLRELLKEGGTARVHKRRCILDFNNVKDLSQWIDIALSNGVIVKLQSVVRTCIAHSEQTFSDHPTFGNFDRVDVAELMAEKKRGIGPRVLDPIAAANKHIAAIDAINPKLLSPKAREEILSAARAEAAAKAAAKPATPSEPNKKSAAKRKAS